MKIIAAILLIFATASCGALDLPNGKQFPSNRALTKHDSGILSYDKGLHFLAGMGTAMVVTEGLRHTSPNMSYTDRRLWGCAVAATGGIAKEFYDRDIMGTRFEALDAVYTAAGCLFTFSVPIGINRNKLRGRF